MDKKKVFVWSLYDFANSFVFITFLLYFSKWIVVNKGLSDWWYNSAFIFGSIALLFLAPWLGSRADKLGAAKKYLSNSTVGCFVFYTAAGVSAVVGTPLWLPMVFFGVGNFLYQLSFVFYNPILNNISTQANFGKISGLGYLANYLGQVAGVLLSLPLVSGVFVIPGVDTLVAPLVPASVIFMLLSLPLILSRGLFNISNATSGPRVTQIELLKKLKITPGVIPFMLSFFLFSDAITTIANNFTILTSSLFEITDKQLSLVILGAILSASLGAWMWGIISDKYDVKRAMIAVLSSWLVFIPLISFSYNFTVYSFFLILSGLSLGGTFAVSRKMFIILTPKEILNYNSGIYAISERAATLVGPLAWSLALSAGGYRMATFSMIIFLFFAVLLITKIPLATNTLNLSDNLA